MLYIFITELFPLFEICIYNVFVRILRSVSINSYLKLVGLILLLLSINNNSFLCTRLEKVAITEILRNTSRLPEMFLKSDHYLFPEGALNLVTFQQFRSRAVDVLNNLIT